MSCVKTRSSWEHSVRNFEGTGRGGVYLAVNGKVILKWVLQK